MFYNKIKTQKRINIIICSNMPFIDVEKLLVFNLKGSGGGGGPAADDGKKTRKNIKFKDI